MIPKKDAEGRIDEWVAERLQHHKNPGEPHVQRRNNGSWASAPSRPNAGRGIRHRPSEAN
jgi:adenylate cyclase